MGGSLEIDIEKCKGCELCVSECPADYLKVSSESNRLGFFYPVVDPEEECTGCGICYTVCPDICITVYRE